MHDMTPGPGTDPALLASGRAGVPGRTTVAAPDGIQA